jgi:hypothetical protein
MPPILCLLPVARRPGNVTKARGAKRAADWSLAVAARGAKRAADWSLAVALRLRDLGHVGKALAPDVNKCGTYSR